MLEKRLLQIAVCVACIVPVLGGLDGIFNSDELTGDVASHMRYLSGLLLGIGLAFLAAVPKIEQHGGRILLLTIIVIIGGLARLSGFITDGIPGPIMQFALVMELVITPGLCLWQRRVARHAI